MGPPGIIWVASRVTKPAKLSESRFFEWYEGQHIQEVTALPGIPAAARYEAVSPSELGLVAAGDPNPEWLMGGKWLTIYEMKDIEYRTTEEFKGLDGQSEPKDNLKEEIFQNAFFETRFGALISKDEKVGAKKGPAKWVISATLTPGSKPNAEELEAFYEQEHVYEISKCPGYVRTRRFRLVDTTGLKEFVRTSAEPVEVGSVLALHEFEGVSLDMQRIAKTDETPWTAKVMGELKKEGVEAGFFQLKRVYGDWDGGSGAKL